ncbi:MAG: manganese efflux pump MntP family protein [Candidatus Micrarchaeota archaeon]
MDYFIIILIAFGLAADSFTVAVARSMANKKITMKTSLTMATYFGFFQGLMPIFGYSIGTRLIDFVSGIDHWVAFFLLCFVGGKMVYESKVVKKDSHTDQKTLFILAIATSIDAFAIGLTFSFLKVNILEAAAIIGVITFVVSLIGCKLGKKFGEVLGGKVEILGGIILIFIGLRILLEHLGFL